MKLEPFNISKYIPKIDASVIDEINRQSQEMMDSITPLNEIFAEEIKPILEGNKHVIEALNENYKMLIIALVSAGIALASLVASIIIPIL